MNRESSRSHSVFTCVIESRWEKDSTTNLRFARLNLVDLAGSERCVVNQFVELSLSLHLCLCICSSLYLRNEIPVCYSTIGKKLLGLRVSV